MTTTHPSFSPAALKTPSAAAVAGILFALLYGASLVLLLSIGYTLWVTRVFPAWVLAISVIFLISEKRS